LELSWISVLTGAFGIGVIKVLWDAIAYFITRYDNQSKIEEKFYSKVNDIELLFSDLIRGAVQIQEALEVYVTDNDISRVLLIKMENGGGIPQLSTVQHISILNESIHPDLTLIDDRLKPIKQDIQNYTADGAYQKMLLLAMNNIPIIMSTDELEVGFLKTMYLGTGIQKFMIIPITHIPAGNHNELKGFMIYMSIEFLDSRDPSNKLDMDTIILKEKIRKIYHEFYIKRIATFT
jgi:hypothetical protein